jgi:hypothetical protein
MAVVALQVQGQVERADEGILKFPWPLMSHPAGKGVFRHPLGESWFTIGERQSRPAAHATQLDAELHGKQTAKREPQRRSVGVEGIALPASMS